MLRVFVLDPPLWSCWSGGQRSHGNQLRSLGIGFALAAAFGVAVALLDATGLGGGGTVDPADSTAGGTADASDSTTDMSSGTSVSASYMF